MGSEEALFLGFIPQPTTDFITHAVLPALALGTGLSASIARLTRASLLQVIREDYIRTARAKGLRERLVVVRHALKNSLIPVVTVLGPMFAAVVTGTVVIEASVRHSRHGQVLRPGHQQPRLPGDHGGDARLRGAPGAANLFVDITYAWLDPRIRYS